MNVLWLVFSLPVFTLGASTCALYEVTMCYARQEDPPVIRTFLRAFRRCFRKGTALFLLVLGTGVFLAADLWCALQWQTGFRFVILVMIPAAAYFCLAVVSHVFQVLTCFDTGVRESVKKAFFLSMSNGVFTVFIMVVNLLPLFLILLFPAFFGQIIFLYLIFGFAVIAFLCSLHLVRLFERDCSSGASHYR